MQNCKMVNPSISHVVIEPAFPSLDEETVEVEMNSYATFFLVLAKKWLPISEFRVSKNVRASG